MVKKSDFSWKPFLKLLFSLAFPVALQNLFTTTGSMIDTMMIARIGELEVGAVGLCAQFSSLMFSCYWGFIGGGMLFFSQYWGSGDHEGINKAYGLTFSCVMLVGIIFSGLAICAPSLVMRLYTDKTSIQQIGVKYLRIVGIGYCFSVLATLMSALLRSTEKVKIPLIAGIVSIVTNCCLNYLLIYGNFGFPRMGIEGAATATAIANGMNVLVIVLCVKIKKMPFVLQVTKHFKWNKALVSEFLIKCTPIIFNELLVGVGNMVINMVLGRQSESAIAATAVMRTLEGCLIGFFSGFSNAGSVLVGKEVGAGNLETAYQRTFRLIYLCMGVVATVGGILILMHTPLLHLMGLSGESFNICFGMMLIYFTIAIIRMGNWCENDVFRSSGDAKFGSVLEITFMWIMVIPCVVVSGLVLHAPFLVVYSCCFVDEIIRFVLMQRHMFKGAFIKPVTPEGLAKLGEFQLNHTKKNKISSADR